MTNIHPDHMEQIMRNLESFRNLRYSQNAIPKYELLSDALLWDDERPDDLKQGGIDVLRFLRRYRIVRLRPDGGVHEPHLETMKADWEMMQTVCPEWPGFHPDRCQNPAVLQVFEKLKEEFNRRYPLPDW